MSATGGSRLIEPLYRREGGKGIATPLLLLLAGLPLAPMRAA